MTEPEPTYTTKENNVMTIYALENRKAQITQQIARLHVSLDAICAELQRLRKESREGG